MSDHKERPILFSAPMVRAILAGRKTQTRRAVKLPLKDRDFGCELAGNEVGQAEAHQLCPYGQPSDRLWVREATVNVEEHGYQGPVFVESEEGRAVLEFGLSPAPDDMTEVEPHEIRKRPSIHMPRWASRILLEITAVRVERLQSISHADAMAEGMAWDDAVYDYSQLWEQINGSSSWDANPWVWVVTFRRIEQ